VAWLLIKRFILDKVLVTDPLPLVVDLDGTLIRADLLIESGLAFIRAQPANLFKPLVWLFNSGKAHLKEKLAHAVDLDVKQLPYNEDVITLIKEKREQGTPIVLATASHKIYADKVAAHLQLFDRVFATQGEVNLSAHHKRDQLIAQYGEGGFDYVGNSKDDLLIWQAARSAYVVEPERGVEVKAKALGNVEHVFSSAGSPLKAWAKTLRLHQWVKNLLLFVPLFASHQWGQPNLLLNGLLAFIFFGFCASSVYILNDLLDLPDDRYHTTKRHRCFASGQLSIKSGLIVCPILLFIAFVGAWWFLPWPFAVALAGYYFLTLAYSFSFKRHMVIDVITLAALYTLRIIAGTFAFAVMLTFWMLAFSMFIFLSLALVKRYAELREARSLGKTEKTYGRGYYPDDLEMIASLGAASGYLSVMVLALYIQDPATIVLYHYPQLIWLACPLLLFWISRIWFITHRGEMNDDPVVFAVKDRISICVGFLFVAIFWFAK
jgi:4-hydroxybenzoate polyprenyltransferase